MQCVYVSPNASRPFVQSRWSRSARTPDPKYHIKKGADMYLRVVGMTVRKEENSMALRNGLASSRPSELRQSSSREVCNQANLCNAEVLSCLFVTLYNYSSPFSVAFSSSSPSRAHPLRSTVRTHGHLSLLALLSAFSSQRRSVFFALASSSVYPPHLSTSSRTIHRYLQTSGRPRVRRVEKMVAFRCLVGVIGLRRL